MNPNIDQTNAAPTNGQDSEKCPKKSQNVTLSQTQLLALDALSRGATISAAADAALVDRRTIYRWLHEDPHFIAHLNHQRLQLLDSIQSRLIALSEIASVNVEQAVNAGNLRASISVLRSLRVLSPMKVGSDDPQTLKRELEIQKHQTIEMLELRESAYNVKTTTRRFSTPDPCFDDPITPVPSS